MRLKIPLLLILLLVAALALAGCSKKEKDTASLLEELYGDEDLDNAPPPEAKGAEQIDDSLYDMALKDTYLELPFRALITAAPWDDPAQIDPTCFISFFLHAHYDSNSSQYADGIPAQELEAFVLRYFDVPVEHIRSTDRYAEDESIYRADELGGGGAAEIRAMDAEQSANLLKLPFYVVDGGDGSNLWSGVLSVEMEPDGAFRYVANEVRNLPEDWDITLDGDYTLLLTSDRPMDPASYIGFSECGDGEHLLCAYQNDAGEYVVQVFQTSDGQGTFMMVFPDDIGRLLWIGAAEDADNRHRFVFEGGVAHYSCGETSYEFEVLPAPLDEASQSDTFSYDVSGGAWVFTDANGLSLYTQEGGARSLLQNSALQDLVEVADPGALTDARLLCGGAKIACTIASEAPEMGLAGTAVLVYDISSGQVEFVQSTNLSAPSRPIADRYLTTELTESSVGVLDAHTGEQLSVDYTGDFTTYDYQTLVSWAYDAPVYEGFRSYVCPASNPGDTGTPLIASSGDKGIVVVAMTQRYVALGSAYAEGFWIGIVPYSPLS